MAGAEIAGIAVVCRPVRKLAKQLCVAYKDDEGIAHEISRMRRQISYTGKSIKFSLKCLESAMEEDTSSKTVRRLNRLRILPELQEDAELIADQLQELYSKLVRAEDENSFRRRFEWVRSRKKKVAAILPDLDVLQKSLMLIHTSMRKAIVAHIRTEDPTFVHFLQEENKRLRLELALHEAGLAQLLRAIKHSNEGLRESIVFRDPESLSRLKRKLIDVSRTAQKHEEEPGLRETGRSQSQSAAATAYQSLRPGHSYLKDDGTQPPVLPQKNLPSRPDPRDEMANRTVLGQKTRSADGPQDTTSGHIYPKEGFSDVRSIPKEVVLPDEDKGFGVYEARTGFIGPILESGMGQQRSTVFVAQSVEENLISVHKAQELNLHIVEKEEEEEEEAKAWLQWVVAQDGSRSKVLGVVNAYWWPKLPLEPHPIRLRLWACEYLKSGVIFGRPFLARERHGN